MSLVGTILVVLLVIFLLGGFSGRFGHTSIGLLGVVLIIVVALVLLGRI